MEPVCSISQAARELQLRRGPFSRASRYAKMQCPFFVRPNVVRIEEVGQQPAECRSHKNTQDPSHPNPPSNESMFGAVA